jgi:hypothetical protein
LFIAHQAIGEAMRTAIATNSKKSFDNRPVMFRVLAPSTFLMPTSLDL